jgi:hypothetical protein
LLGAAFVSLVSMHAVFVLSIATAPVTLVLCCWPNIPGIASRLGRPYQGVDHGAFRHVVSGTLRNGI